MNDEKLDKSVAMEKVEDPELEDILEAVPISQEAKKTLSYMLSMRYSEQRMVSPSDKLAEKLEPEHITKIIESAEKDDARSFSAFKIEKFTTLTVFVIALIFAVVLLIMFKDSEYLTMIITALFSFLGGLGVGRFTSQNKK